MKTFILAVLLLTLLSSCDSTIIEGTKINRVTNYEDGSSISLLESGQEIYSKQHQSIGSTLVIQPVQPEISLKLPMRDAESRQCLNCDTVVITHYVDYKEATVTLSDTTIHYYHSH